MHVRSRARTAARDALRWFPAAVVALALSAGVVACAGGGASEPTLSPAGQEGKRLAVSRGCATCHNFSGKDAAGPTWQGLYMSQVTLADGTTVLADEAYLTRSIKDPGSQKVKGFGTVMPKNNLTDEEVALIVGYIKELSPDAAAAGSGS